MIKAIYLDFDGVLTTDATGTTTIINFFKSNTELDSILFEKVYRKHNKNLLYGHTTHEKVWPQICEEMGKNIDFQILVDSFVSTPIDREILRLSIQLKDEGFFIGIITDNKKDRIDAIFSIPEYKSIFDKIIVSSEIGSGKKENSIFYAAIQHCDFSFDECIFIDNNEENLIVPNQLGFKTIYFDHENRNYKKLKMEIKNFIEEKPN